MTPLPSLPESVPVPVAGTASSGTVSLETERLVIRDHVPGDLESLLTLLRDAKVMHFIEDLKVTDREGARRNLQVAMDEALRRDRTKYFFAITEKVGGAYVGEIGFTVLERGARGWVVEMGYFIHERYWGRGLVTEAGRRVIRFAFEDCGVERILIGCYRENIGSERVMIKLGFTLEREFEGPVHHEGESATRVAYRLDRADARP